MKKKYEIPETGVTWVTIEKNILSNYSSSSADMSVDNSTYSDLEWDYE